MDTRVNAKKLGLKERYAAMTRGLGWEPSYQPRDKVFPFDATNEALAYVESGRAKGKVVIKVR